MNETVIGVDVGGTSTKLAEVSRDGTVAHWRCFPTRGPLADYRERLLREVRTVMAEGGQAVGLACGVAGFVSEEGTLLYNGNLPWLEGAPIGAWLRELGSQVIVESDSNTACAGEALYGLQHDPPVRRLLCVTAGTGVGVGAMVDGELQRTAFGCLGDAGHVIVAPDGPACTCGGRGCAEAVLSTQVLGRHYSNAGFRRLVADAAANVPAAVSVALHAGSFLGIALASLANIFVPDRVAVAGGLAHLGAPLLQAADCAFRRHTGTFIEQRCRLTLASTASQATLLGAAACFFGGLGARS